MSERKSNGISPSASRSLTVSENETSADRKQENDQAEQLNRRSATPRQSNASIPELDRPRSKTGSTTSTNNGDAEHPTTQPTATSAGFNLLQSIKDVTHQELNRANPLGLLGKEVIYATGTTHCPEPVPPRDRDEPSVNQTRTSSSSSSISPLNELEPQQLQFSLNEEEKQHMQRRRSTLANRPEMALPPCPAEFVSVSDDPNQQPHLFSAPLPNSMLVDFIPDTMSINVFEVFIYAWGVLAFFFDMFTDLVLAHAYYLEGAYWLFILTLMCVILPNLTLSVFSLVWYIDSSQLKAAAHNGQSKTDYQTSRQTSCSQSDDLIDKDQDQVDAHVSRIRQPPAPPEQTSPGKTFQLSSATVGVFTWIIRIVILVLQLDLCLKYIRGLYYTWKGFQKRHDPKWKRFYLTKQILIDADIALLRVFDCFMDSGSQVVLQLYIMLRLGTASTKFDTLFAKQCLSIVSSLGSLAYALSGYSRCWRHMQLTHSPQGWPEGRPAPQLVSWWSTIVQWFWYLFLITPRVLALAMFAATFRSWFWIILVAHWFGMLFWILRFRTIFCISDQTKYNPREAIFEKCYNLVCSYIFIFCYMNLRKGDTRLHYIGFYTIYYIENISFSIIYAIHSAESNSIFKYSLVIFVCVGFWLAILFQFIYYRFLHPSDHVRVNTKQNLASFARIRPFPRLNRMKKSKSCEEMIDQHDVQNPNENNDQCETISLQLNNNSINERWHNRFSKENRQKLISQQQAIDQKVKLTRAQKQLEQTQSPSQSLFSRISSNLKRPTTISIPRPIDESEHHSTILHTSSVDFPPTRRQPFFNVSRVSLPRSPHQESYAKMGHEDDDDDEDSFHTPSISHMPEMKTPPHQQQVNMYSIDEDTHLSANEGGTEMILTAATLTMPCSSPFSAATQNETAAVSSTPTHTSRC